MNASPRLSYTFQSPEHLDVELEDGYCLGSAPATEKAVTQHVEQIGGEYRIGELRFELVVVCDSCLYALLGDPLPKRGEYEVLFRPHRGREHLCVQLQDDERIVHAPLILEAFGDAPERGLAEVEGGAAVVPVPQHPISRYCGVETSGLVGLDQDAFEGLGA